MARLALVFMLAAVLALAIVACGESTSPDSGGTTPAPASSEASAPADVTDGAELYAAYCAGCHGADGGGGSAPPVTGDDSGEVSRLVSDGAGGMPGFAGQLTQAQIEAVSEFVTAGLE